MLFGLSNAPTTFQRTLDLLLSKYKWKTAIIYLSNVIVYSDTLEQHIAHVDEILTALEDPDVTLKLKKCQLFTATREFGSYH